MANRTPEQRKAYFAAYYQKNREKALEYARQRREANRERLRLEAVEYRKRNPGATTRYRQANRDKVLAREAEYRARNADKIAAYKARPEVQQRMRDYDREWKRAHPEKRPDYSSPEDRARLREYRRQWDRAHPEVIRRKAADRRAKIRGVYVESVDPLEVLRRGKGVCGICSSPVDPANFHVDHIHPLALGGEHSYANTQPAHPSCNVRKGAKAA